MNSRSSNQESYYSLATKQKNKKKNKKQKKNQKTKTKTKNKNKNKKNKQKNIRLESLLVQHFMGLFSKSKRILGLESLMEMLGRILCLC